MNINLGTLDFILATEHPELLRLTLIYLTRQDFVNTIKLE